MTPEEKQEIVNEVTEQLYRSLPEIVSNLLKTVQSHTDLIIDFYDMHPEFKEHHEIAGQIISDVEGKNPLKEYQEVIDIAIPKIQKAIELKERADKR